MQCQIGAEIAVEPSGLALRRKVQAAKRAWNTAQQDLAQVIVAVDILSRLRALYATEITIAEMNLGTGTADRNTIRFIINL